MKLVVAIVQDKDAIKLVAALMEQSYRTTKLASTGGFLREGNTTLLVGIEDAKVDHVLGIIKEICHSREQLVTPLSPMGGAVDSFLPYPVEVTVGGATVFVLDVERFVRI